MYNNAMDIILNIGFFFGFITFILYLIVFGIVLFEFASAYVNGRMPVRPQVVNWIFREPFHMYSWDRDKYEELGQDPDQALTGEYAAAVGAGGAVLVFAMVGLWPIILTLLALKVMREYNTNEQFRSLFKSDAQQTFMNERLNQTKKETPLKGIDRL